MAAGVWEKVSVRKLLLAALPLGLVGGCAGYAIDYVKPKTSILAPELARYGLDPAQSACVGERLGSSLSVWQLRQLARSAGAVTQGYATPGRLTAPDLLWVGKNVEDPNVAIQLTAAAEGCGLSLAPATTAQARPADPTPPSGTDVPPPAAPSASTAATPPAPGGRTPAGAAPAASWVNLGAAATGQSIAVDATSMEQGPSYRQAWFRTTNPGEGRPSRASYLLRIDCAAKTINPMALRRHGPTGAVAEQRDYGPNGEGAMPVEGGTVMEIAYLALCT
jgi:hypothetical protein